MILLEILSMYTSNSRIFIHHVIGQIIFFIPSTTVDIYRIKNNDEKNIHIDFKHFIIYILDWILDNTSLTYKKYLMEIKFIPPFIVCFVFGLIDLIFLLILLSFKLINRNVICFEQKCFDIFNYDTSNFKNNVNLAFSIIISIIFSCIFFFFFYHIFDLFTSSHIVFIFYIFVMVSSIKSAKNNNLSLGGWLLIFLAFIFTLLGLFIYLEIIELNFCDLNKNTRNRIAERAKEKEIDELYLEMELPKKDEDEDGEEKNDKQKVEVVPGYLIDI